MSQRYSIFWAAVLVFCALPPALGGENPAAPLCRLKQMDTGERYDLGRFRGKVLYVDFWASWCTSCVQSFPFLNQLKHDLNGQGLEVLGINLDEKPEDAAAFLARYPARFRVAFDAGKNCPKDFGVLGMPSSYLVDRDGNIRFVHLGFKAGDAGQIRTQIERLLKQ